MHTDMTAVTIQSNKIVSSEVRQLSTTRATLQKKPNKLFGQPNISIRFEQISFYRENHRSKMAVLC